MSKLTQAPWGSCNDAMGAPSVVCLGSVLFHGTTHSEQADAEFIALARNAFDVMIRRANQGWSVYRTKKGFKLNIYCFRSEPKEFVEWVCASRFPDPLVAWIESDKWYKEHVESKEAAVAV